MKFLKASLIISLSISLFLASCKKEGCTDVRAENFDFEATADNGSCVYAGCMDENSDNYDPNASIDDGSCYRYGCTNQYAINYDPLATSNDGKCEYAVKYTTNCADCFVTFENRGGGTSQQDNVTSSWSYSFTGSPNDFVYISAQNNNDNGSVTVNILLGDYTFKSSSSSGAYVIATASGSLPE
jgi:hypothetical protein